MEYFQSVRKGEEQACRRKNEEGKREREKVGWRMERENTGMKRIDGQRSYGGWKLLLEEEKGKEGKELKSEKGAWKEIDVNKCEQRKDVDNGGKRERENGRGGRNRKVYK